MKPLILCASILLGGFLSLWAICALIIEVQSCH
jgi:hypothetical protein